MIDVVMVMSVNPGFGGQAFIASSLEKIAIVRDMIGSRDILIEVDGGVSTENARDVVRAGADVLVAGTAIFKARNGDYRAAIDALRVAG